MPKTETLEDFYQHKSIPLPVGLREDYGHFNVFQTEECNRPGQRPVEYRKRDFYKIALIRGSHVYHFADKSLQLSGPTLMFSNPSVPYTFEQQSEITGYFCIFREAFFSRYMRGDIKELPIFIPGHQHPFALTDAQDEQVSILFEKMLEEMKSDYPYKFDLILHYVMELIHFAMKMQPAQPSFVHTDANARLLLVFNELLDRQFPIDSKDQQFTLKSPKECASRLFVHVNHLNRALRATTGKTTSELISERIIKEAIALLRHTDWSIADIGYCLGFENAASFNHFFRKHSKHTPSEVRKQNGVLHLQPLPSFT